jgi:hypothetical protein
MSGQSMANYHRLRAAAEKKRAEESADAKCAALHRELAELHLIGAGDGETLELTDRLAGETAANAPH